MPISSSLSLRSVLFLALFSLAGGTASTLARPAEFIPLPPIGGGAARATYALGVSPDGRFAAGASASDRGVEAVTWDLQSRTVRALGFLAPTARFSEAYAVSNDGTTIVGRSLNPTQFEAFRVVGSGAMQGLGSLGSTADNTRSGAFDISGDGSRIIGFSRSPRAGAGFEAFLFQASMLGLGDLAGGPFSSVARGVSADGAIIVGESSDATGNRATRWTQATGLVALPDLSGGAVGATAQAVSADGAVVVGRSIGADGAFAVAWRQGQVENLGALGTPANDSQAFSVSGDGSIIVGTSLTSAGDEAFIWTRSAGMRNLKAVLTSVYGLSLTGWSLLAARDISTDGVVIVGEGINPQGVSQAWMVRLDAGCPADFNGDGQADLFDYLDFAAAFGTDDPSADLNADGQVDLFDYLDFVVAFDAGC
ncbi:MAG: GC-type dockerin domain-anchored protein [Planctomycetota bacterium]|nr:GC-type dockerin domain-anchored protein [Planctomycetota bacterium]